MRFVLPWLVILLALSGTAGKAAAPASPPARIVAERLAGVEAVACDERGGVFVSLLGKVGTAGDGAVGRIVAGRFEPICTGLDDPRGIAFHGGKLYVCDRDRVIQIDPHDGNTFPFAPPHAFPARPTRLNGIAIDLESGTVYVTDSGDTEGNGSAIYRIAPRGEVERLAAAGAVPELKMPNGIVIDGPSHLLVVDSATGTLLRMSLATRELRTIAQGFGFADGLVWDTFGRLFVSDWQSGRVFMIPRVGDEPTVVLDEGPGSVALGVSYATGELLVPNFDRGTLAAMPLHGLGWAAAAVPDVAAVPGFPDVDWTAWTGEDDDGRPREMRPIALTAAPDGKHLMLATQEGLVLTWPAASPQAKASVFADLRDRVRHVPEQNEEGLLGFALHPRFPQDGRAFVFFTRKEPASGYVNVLTEYRLATDGQMRLDPASERVLLEVERPFWNHDGGTLAFGPDGMLYVAVGDGGFSNDRLGVAQNLDSLLGKILRIDVNRRDGSRPYGIPTDNPFVGRQAARPEVWALGLRNVWRFAFDRTTGAMFAADVGQKHWEEVNVIRRGGNYGWPVREAAHPFGANGTGPRADLEEPIWEYGRAVGQSIIGGCVYRGRGIPSLDGAYLCADHVSGAVFAVRHDPDSPRAAAAGIVMRSVPPILSFGEDAAGEVYLLRAAATTSDAVVRLVARRDGAPIQDPPSGEPLATR